MRALLSLLVPPACAGCRAPLARDGPVLCPACARDLPWLRGACRRCALPSHGARPCPAAGAAFDRAWSAVAYVGPARGLVHALKLGGALPLAATLAAAIAANLPRELRGLPIVPVPPQRARARRRGFDPVGLLAAELTARTGAPLLACLLRTDRGARRRTGAKRRGGVVFALVAPPPRHALLLDDVHTTGATLDAAARVLRAGGCEAIAAVTYARTLR